MVGRKFQVFAFEQERKYVHARQVQIRVATFDDHCSSIPQMIQLNIGLSVMKRFVYVDEGGLETSAGQL